MGLERRQQYRWAFTIPKCWPGVAVLKATIALTITLSLIFIRPFANVNPRPTSWSGTILVVVVGCPGYTIGACLENVLLGTAGLASGVVTFAILAALADSPVAQGFVFAFYVYLAALVRAGGPRYISFYLYGVLFAFNGIYTPIVSGGAFSWDWLLATFEAYIWGIAIVLAVNLIVWPVSSEHETRRLLVSSLNNISTLAHLLCKTYAKEIDKVEAEVRDLLIRTIRSDYLALSSRLEETGYETPWTSYRLEDWQHIVQRVQGLQQALITSSSALELIDSLDTGQLSRHLLSEHTKTFAAFRNGIDLVIASVVDQIMPRKHLHREPDHSSLATIPPEPATDTAVKPDPGGPQGGASISRRRTQSETLTHVTNLSKRLRREVELSEQRQAHSRVNSAAGSENVSRAPSLHRGRSGGRSEDPFGAEASAPVDEDTLERDLEAGLADVNTAQRPVEARREAPVDSEKEAGAGGRSDAAVVAHFRDTWTAFAKAQADALIHIIRDGSLDVEDKLRIERGLPSLAEMYSDRLPKAWSSSLVTPTPLDRRTSSRIAASSYEDSAAKLAPDSNDLETDANETPCSEALTKSYSLLFGLGQLSDELCGLHAIVSQDRPKRIRPYLFQTLARHLRSVKWWGPRSHMPLQEALALLRRQEYRPPKRSLLRRLVMFEKWLRQDRSMYALKVACGAATYSVFILAPELRQRLFLKYGMNSSLITVIVAITPTIGGTLSTWILQLGGTGVGSLFGLIVLEIFQNVGGYRYNPFGLCAAFSVWCALASALFYRFPKYYTAGLLLVTGCGNNLVLEYLYNELPTVEATLADTQDYDAPPIRFAYTLASMAISIAISAVFQLLVLRTPAKQQLRLKIADVTFALSSYNTLLQSYVNVVAPADEAVARPAPEALLKIERELIKRESSIQASILSLGPLYAVAKLEPTFGTPFKGDVLLKVIRTHQILLDRLREARTAVGTEGFGESVHRSFVLQLYPYRLHSQKLSRTLFFLGATSLVSKTQLARDVPSSRPTWSSFEHDALVLSRRLSQLPSGIEELKRPGFLRYWFYLVSLGSVSNELELLEEQLGALFGSELSNPAIF